MKLALLLSGVIGLVTLVVACNASPSPTPTPTPPPNSQTFGVAADAGKTVFSTNCAGCHGANGQGVSAPALWGTAANLAKYNTAQGLLNFISSAMPASSPGSLSHQNYLNVLGYLLVQNNDVTPTTPFNESQLNTVTLK